MSIPYHEYETQIFNRLQSYRETHPQFTFSVRQNGSKGSERDYFIGTYKSRYFGFTCWEIPISFPGSSSDCVDFFFNYGSDGRPGFYMEASAPKKAGNDQLAACAAFVYNLRKLAGQKSLPVGPNAEDKKFIDYYFVPEPKLYDTLEDLWSAFLPFLETATTMVDEAVSITKNEFPKWQAERISLKKFNDYIVKMKRRFERYPAIKSIADQPSKEDDVVSKVKELQDQEVKLNPLNQILYGPPGTGKTYHTINKAIEIIDPKFYKAHSQSRKKLLERFGQLLIKDWDDPKGQIAFTTFHQSMSYEDFVEGIKPVPEEEQINSNTSPIRYEIMDGVFKLIAQKASWTKGNFDGIMEAFKSECNEVNGKSPITITAPYTSFDVIYRGTTVFYVSPHNSVKGKPWYPVNLENIRKVYQTGDYKGIYNPTYVREILNYLMKQKGLVPVEKTQNSSEPHVLIIDEINRGNVAQIFGELITLIETSKRAGNDEQLEAMLTYSKQPFTVPANLFIIGTMNTADRSVEALDAALRRRFAFEEMMPEPDLLSPYALLTKFHEKYFDVKWEQWEKNFSQYARDFYDFLGLLDFPIAGEEEKNLVEIIEQHEFNVESASSYLHEYDLDPEINVAELLKIINQRIEVLYDREHMLGHSFFYELLNGDHPLTALRQIFKDEIIPLLQEYFFNDYAKIGLVLGKEFIRPKYSGQIKSSFFAEFPGVSIEDYVRPVYEINKEVLSNNDHFKKALNLLLRKPIKTIDAFA